MAAKFETMGEEEARALKMQIGVSVLCTIMRRVQVNRNTRRLDSKEEQITSWRRCS